MIQLWLQIKKRSKYTNMRPQVGKKQHLPVISIHLTVKPDQLKLLAGNAAQVTFPGKYSTINVVAIQKVHHLPRFLNQTQVQYCLPSGKLT